MFTQFGEHFLHQALKCVLGQVYVSLIWEVIQISMVIFWNYQCLKFYCWNSYSYEYYVNKIRYTLFTQFYQNILISDKFFINFFSFIFSCRLHLPLPFIPLPPPTSPRRFLGVSPASDFYLPWNAPPSSYLFPYSPPPITPFSGPSYSQSHPTPSLDLFYIPFPGIPNNPHLDPSCYLVSLGL